MQFHLNGFRGSQDPKLLEFEGEREPDFQSNLPDEVDVLIVGAGPAGQLLGTQLARFPDITTRIIESKPGRLEQGQADGLQCRTIEVFEAFGFSERVLKEAYWVNETTFWSPTGDGKGLRRSGRIRDTEEGLSEFPHVILNQARLHDLWLDAMKYSPTRLEPTYNRSLLDLHVPEQQDARVQVTLQRVDKGHRGEKEQVSARYVVGCDGARSAVRQSLGYKMEGDFANQGWGVMDALVVTDFPDIRLKTAIHSAGEGSVLIIPREGGYLVRLYIELDKLAKDERLSSRRVTSDILIDRAQRIFSPFKLDVRYIAYWSVYEVGQRLTDHFDDCAPGTVAQGSQAGKAPRVFIAGDACHTHSAKAGQGMNVSMNDTYNLGWKLASVLHGTAQSRLLHTYSEERQPLAQLLINFDKEISKLFAAKPKARLQLQGADVEEAELAKEDEEGTVDPAVFQEYFTRQGRFMAGVETCYAPSLITSADKQYQDLAKGFQIGTRFHSAQVLRLSDAKPVQLGHIMDADGRWRIILLGNKDEDPTSTSSKLWKTCECLEREVVPRFTPQSWNVDAVLDVRCVLPLPRQSLTITDLPPLLLPHKGKFGLQDYEKVFTDEESYGFGGGSFYKDRGVSAENGVVLLVRPDQYIAGMWPLGESAARGIEGFCARFMVSQ